MKSSPVSPPATGSVPSWAGILPVMGLLGAALPLFLTRYMKDRKMTKLEKACVSLVIALGEKLEESERRNEQLTKELGESASKKQYEDLVRRADDLEGRLAEMTGRAERAEAKPATPAAEARPGRRPR